MEQAHTQLIAQLNERILAADNTPLYIKFAETVKNAVRSGVLEHGNILPGERDLSQLTGVSRITVRKAMQALEEEGVVTRSRGYGTQINNIFEYSLKEARGFSQQVVLRGKKPDTLWVNKRVVKCPEEVAQQLAGVFHVGSVTRERHGQVVDLHFGSQLDVGLVFFRDRKSTRLNSSHYQQSRMPSSA